MANTADILSEVALERAAQDRQWGGADHDDQHPSETWDGLIWKFLRRAAASTDAARSRLRADGALRERRQRLIQVAALAVAAVEALDRVPADSE